MVKNHPFVDANKRTAWLVTSLLMRRSGYDLRLEPEDKIDDLVVGVAEDEIDFEELVAWFKKRLYRA
jgi:death-on-curing protein